MGRISFLFSHTSWNIVTFLKNNIEKLPSRHLWPLTGLAGAALALKRWPRSFYWSNSNSSNSSNSSSRPQPSQSGWWLLSSSSSNSNSNNRYCRMGGTAAGYSWFPGKKRKKLIFYILIFQTFFFQEWKCGGFHSLFQLRLLSGKIKIHFDFFTNLPHVRYIVSKLSKIFSHHF